MILIEKSWVMFRFPLYCSSKDILLEDGSREISFFYIFPLPFIPSAFFSRAEDLLQSSKQRNPTPSSPRKEAFKFTGDSARSNEIGIKLYIALKLVVLLWCWLQMSLYHGEVSGGPFSWVFWLVVWNIFYFHPEPWENDPIWLIFFKWVETTN